MEELLHPLASLKKMLSQPAPRMSSSNIHKPIHQHRHVSMFSAMHRGSSRLLGKMINLSPMIAVETMDKKVLQDKMYRLLEDTLSDTTKLANVLCIFQKDKSNAQPQPFQQIINRQQNNQSLSKLSDRSQSKIQIFPAPKALMANRTSIMTKNNRISLAQAININQLQEFKNSLPLQAIDSVSSLPSQEQFMPRFEHTASIRSLSSNSNSLKAPLRQQKARAPKVSIMMMGSFRASSFSSSKSSSLFSEQDIELPSVTQLLSTPMLFSPEIIQTIFQTPSNHHSILALALLYKFLALSLYSPSRDTMAWLLSVSMVVAYKMSEDRGVGGLLGAFAQCLGCSVGQMGVVERWFVEGMGYRVIVAVEEYQQIVGWLLN